MKRDLDLVRSILQWMEAQEGGRNIGWRITIDGYTAEQIGYHVYLMADAGLIVATDATWMDDRSPCCEPEMMRWAGHEFLDASKDSKIWAKAKTNVIGPAGSVAFSVLLEWLKSETLQRIGLNP